MNNSLKDAATSDLVSELATLIGQKTDLIVRACAILAELRARRVDHPAMKNGVLKWFQSINAGKLDAHFFYTFAGVQSLIQAVVGTPLKLQRQWADGSNVTLKEVNAAFEIVEVEKPLIRFSRGDIANVFGPAGVRALAEQEKLLRSKLANVAASPAPKVERVRADVKEGVLIIGSKRLRLVEFRDALRALGWYLHKIEDRGEE